MTAQDTRQQASTADLLAKQKEYIWPCAATYYERPVALSHGEGMHVWDAEGNRYLDCFGGVLTTNVFQSFREFSEREGLDPDHVKEKFRSDPSALAAQKPPDRRARILVGPDDAKLIGAGNALNEVEDAVLAGVQPGDK